MKAHNTDEDVVSFRKRMTSIQKEEEELAQEFQRMETIQEEQKLMDVAKEQEKELAVQRQEKKLRTKEKVDTRLSQFQAKKDTKLFCSHYYLSKAGSDYYTENPVKPPSEEVMMRMAQRINRSNLEKAEGENNDPEAEKTQQVNTGEDNPIVALEPEEQPLLQPSMDKSRKNKSISQQIGTDEQEQTTSGNNASLYAQEKQYLKVLEQEGMLKAEEHHVIKTKDFNVYGKLRTEKPNVKVTTKSKVPSELNEKFITTECITDRRVKIASMANRQYINAPAVEEVRKQGQHQMI